MKQLHNKNRNNSTQSAKTFFTKYKIIMLLALTVVIVALTNTSITEASTIQKGYLEKTTVNNAGGYCVGNSVYTYIDGPEKCLRANGQWVPSSSATITDTIKFTYDSTTGVITFSKAPVVGIVAKATNLSNKYDSCRNGRGWGSKHFFAYQNNLEGVFEKPVAQMNSHKPGLVFDESGPWTEGAETCQTYLNDTNYNSIMDAKNSWLPLVGNPESSISGSGGTLYSVQIPYFHLNKSVLEGKKDFEWVNVYFDNGLQHHKRYVSESYQLFWEGNVSSGGSSAVKGSLERKVDTSTAGYCVGYISGWPPDDAHECTRSSGQWVPPTSGSRTELIRFVYYPNEGYIRTENPSVLGLVINPKNFDRTKFDSCRTGEGYGSEHYYAYQNNLQGVFTKPISQMNNHKPSLVFDEHTLAYQGAEYCRDYAMNNGYRIMSIKETWRPWVGNPYRTSSGSSGTDYSVEIPKFHLSDSVIKGKLDFEWINVMFDNGINNMERFVTQPYQLFWGFGGSADGGSSGPPPKIVCPAGTVPKPNAEDPKWCDNYVKVDKIVPGGDIGKIDLGDLLNNGYGSTGDRGDWQFGKDNGNHNNGWYIDGSGKGYKTSHIQYTNIPDNGYVNALGNSWSPEYLITQGKLKIQVPLPSDATTVEKQKRDTDLNSYKASKSLSEVIAYKATDLEALKAIQNSPTGLRDLFTKTGSDYKYGDNIVSHTVDSNGESDYSKLKIKDSGYYILATKFVDRPSAIKEQANPSQAILDKHTYYSFVPVSVNFMVDLGYLPIYNNLLSQVNETMLTIGVKKANHKLSSLAYQNYKSLKVPSAFSHKTNKTLLGSQTGGLQLLDKDLNPVAIKGETALATTVNVLDVIEYSNDFYVATDKGILHLDSKTDTLSKTSIAYSVNDLQVEQDSLYVLTDTTLRVAFVGEGELIMSYKEYDLKELFSDASVKAGRIEEVNGLLNISSKDDGSLSEVITLTK